MPHGLRIARRTARSALGVEAELAQVQPQALGVEQAEHDLLAEERRQHRDAEVDRRGCVPRSLNRALMRPSCGRRFSAMSSRAMILMRDTSGSRILERRRHHRLQHAVDAEPDAQLLFVRLDVDVAGAPLDGGQSISALTSRMTGASPPCCSSEAASISSAGARTSDVVVGVVEAEVFEAPCSPGRRRPCRSRRPRHLRAGGAVVQLAIASLNRRLGGDHRLDVQAGDELDVVHREDVGRDPSSPASGCCRILPTGMTLYLAAVSAGISRMTRRVEIESR